MRILALVFMCCFALNSFASSKNEFESISAGFKLKKPASWLYMTAEENLENVKKIKFSDEEMQKNIAKYATAPLVSLVKYAEPFEDLNPSFKVNIKPLGQLKGADPKKILDIITPSLQKAMKGFTIMQAPTDVKIDGLDGGYMRVNYTLSTADGLEFPTTSELWIVPRGEYFFMIGAGTRQDEKTGTRSEIQSILKTISIQK